MPYDLFTHRHNFAVWAAARAAQRGFTSVQNLAAALEASGVHRFLADLESLNITCERFEELHRIWCRTIVDYLNDCKIKNVTYGRAAKLLAVYLKSMVVTGGAGYSSLARCIHPPIDRRLLQALAGDIRYAEEKRVAWRQTNWTQLNEAEYYELIEGLRGVLPAESPFWMLEKYWTASDKEGQIVLGSDLRNPFKYQ